MKSLWSWDRPTFLKITNTPFRVVDTDSGVVILSYPEGVFPWKGVRVWKDTLIVGYVFEGFINAKKITCGIEETPTGRQVIINAWV